MDDQNPPPRPGNYERSWNDPPLFSYASGTQASTETKKAGGNKLNKRVGHSIANTANGVSPEIDNLDLLRGDLETNRYKPSMQSDNMPPPPPTMMNPNQNVQEVSSKPLQVLPYDYKNTSTPNQPQENFNISASQIEPKTSNVEVVISDLYKVLENAKPELGEKKVSDIKKRILLMKSKWQNGELNCHVEDGMTKMAKCLLLAQESMAEVISCKKDLNAKQLAREAIDDAERIQRGLMVDWSSLCGTWMVGIKHLVQEVKRILISTGNFEPFGEAKGIEAPL